jgi:signal transduction histidine kinase
VTILDSGGGIAAEHLLHIFDHVFRINESRSRATGGSGLGLAIVKQLVELRSDAFTSLNSEDNFQPGSGLKQQLPAPLSRKVIIATRRRRRDVSTYHDDFH